MAHVLAALMPTFLSTPSERRATRPLYGAFPCKLYFYPRPPRGGRRELRRTPVSDTSFLFTPSARRATSNTAPYASMMDDFYPRPPRGGRPFWKSCLSFSSSNFYPRPPRGGRPGTRHSGGTLLSKFLSTPSERRATLAGAEIPPPAQNISIHALREEGDAMTARAALKRRYFYPRPPRGGRLSATRKTQSSIPISIHALREEGDHADTDYVMSGEAFLSTPSARRATRGHEAYSCDVQISIHALREEGDCRPS